MSSVHYTFLLKEKAKELGFAYCRISKADFLHKEALQLEKWLAKDYHGEMSYMENHFDKRLDPRLLVDDAKSIISLRSKKIKMPLKFQCMLLEEIIIKWLSKS